MAVLLMKVCVQYILKKKYIYSKVLRILWFCGTYLFTDAYEELVFDKFIIVFARRGSSLMIDDSFCVKCALCEV